MTLKSPRQHNERHLDFIRSLPCVCCMNNIETEAAHIRFSDARAAKDNAGVGAKPDDSWTVPLCGDHHRIQHHMGSEKRFWAQYGIDPIFLAMALYRVSGDHERGLKVIQACQPTNILAAG